MLFDRSKIGFKKSQGETHANQSLRAVFRCPFSQGGCVAVAALVQYFLMAAFCWMLIEGIYLYLFVVRVYNVGNKLKICHGISWGKLLCDH